MYKPNCVGESYKRQQRCLTFAKPSSLARKTQRLQERGNSGKDVGRHLFVWRLML